MTTQTETTKEKQLPAFYIFDTVESDGKKENKRVNAGLKLHQLAGVKIHQ